MDGLIAYILSKKYAKSQGDSAKAYADEVGRRVEEAGFKAQVEQDRSILEGAGQVKILYLLPKESDNPKDGYDEYIYADNKWEWIGHTDIVPSKTISGVVNQNGTITFTNSDGSTFTTTGESVIGPQGADYILTNQDKTDIANIVLSELPTTQGVQYGNTSN